MQIGLDLMQRHGKTKHFDYSSTSQTPARGQDITQSMIQKSSDAKIMVSMCYNNVVYVCIDLIRVSQCWY